MAALTLPDDRVWFHETAVTVPFLGQHRIVLEEPAAPVDQIRTCPNWLNTFENRPEFGPTYTM